MRAALVASLLVAISCTAVAAPIATRAFTRIEKGMGEQRVLALVGPPTAEGPYRPRVDRVLAVIGFGDTYRTYFYRGMGRVLFVGGNPLFRKGTVAKVEIDPEEPGKAR